MHALGTQRTLREHEDVFFRKDGSMVEISCSYAPFVLEGEVAGAVLVVRDITERKQAEQEITRRTHQQAVVADLGQLDPAERPRAAPQQPDGVRGRRRLSRADRRCGG